MGKKGELLRQQKAQNVTYTFTRAQLEEHDKKILETYKERVREDCREQLRAQAAEYQKEIDRHIDEEWERREALIHEENGISELLSLLLCVSSRILIEDFGWKPIGKVTRRNKTVKFAEKFAETITDICTDESKDIRAYCDETYELYGVTFRQVDM